MVGGGGGKGDREGVPACVAGAAGLLNQGE